MGGTPQRMKGFAEFMLKELGYVLPTGTCLLDISERSHRSGPNSNDDIHGQLWNVTFGTQSPYL
jgi:hypothetical protein